PPARRSGPDRSRRLDPRTARSVLSGLPLKSKRRLVTTDGEFHSLRRQLDRLGEEGVAIVRVPAHPVASLAERVRKEITAGTAAVLLSAVLFETAEIVPGLGSIAAAC